jgi:hypothetical protein
MSATSNAHLQELLTALNYYAGEKPDYVKQVAEFPRPPIQAVIWFVAYQIYLINDLDKLANYSCTVATVTHNLPEDEVFAGSAIVAPIPATGKTLTAIFGWFAELSPGMLAHDKWQIASGGDLRLMSDDRILHTIPTVVFKNSKRGVWFLRVDNKP